ncbi:hypothetical protein BS78_01G247700 [Paspalum vaginatum]|nr:hypothetical protein BS78_01G247700 [Paspalum vaginatum]
MQMQPLVPGGFLTRHGFPPGVRFVPTELELVSILSCRVRGNPLPSPVATIFHDVNVLSFHPKELHEMYKQHEEERYIYFFSHRQLQKLLPADEKQKVPRPVRVAKNGGWKASGPAKLLRSPEGNGRRRFVAGRMATMVFYDTVVNEKGVKSASLKTNWAMNEITIPRDQRLSSVASNTRFYDLALYRLYSLEKKAGDTEAETSAGTGAGQALENVVSDHLPAPSMAVASCPPAGQPFGVSTANQQLAVGPSTSAWMPPPPQHRLSIQHAQYYYPHDQYASFGAAQQQQLHAMPMHASIGPAAHLFPLVGPPALAPVPRSPYLMPPSTLPPADVRPPVEQQQLHPATTGTTHGAGQEVGRFGVVTRSSYLMPPPSTLPPADVRPPVEQLPPATTGTHGAGKDEAGHFGVASSPCSAPVAGSSGSPPSQQPATATTTTEPSPPDQDIVVPDAQENGMEVLDWLPDLADLDENDFRFRFTMEELMGGSVLDDDDNEPLPMQETRDTTVVAERTSTRQESGVKN